MCCALKYISLSEQFSCKKNDHALHPTLKKMGKHDFKEINKQVIRKCFMMESLNLKAIYFCCCFKINGKVINDYIQ